MKAYKAVDFIKNADTCAVWVTDYEALRFLRAHLKNNGLFHVVSDRTPGRLWNQDNPVRQRADLIEYGTYEECVDYSVKVKDDQLVMCVNLWSGEMVYGKRTDLDYEIEIHFEDGELPIILESYFESWIRTEARTKIAQQENEERAKRIAYEENKLKFQAGLSKLMIVTPPKTDIEKKFDALIEILTDKNPANLRDRLLELKTWGVNPLLEENQ